MIARADYRLNDRVLQLFHTEVPNTLRHRGIAGMLVAAALDHARKNGLAVLPQCSYARNYMRRHPESAALLPEGVTLKAATDQ